ncbi:MULTISPECIES: ACP S-malonyltransferase [unclassified Pseudoalteromonas]|uniref:ACP S-malonyltransferase n=1 Tax=unclassified Pseudoalteromonas TaxID=194690 RepID=UPI0025B36DBC|nr:MULTISPECIES: ACP S-malonyltransferase [unclassified Pseudoalteromonas]MDN3379146.1 ACP S-malonyltransferase [Pseudoalteromonas sp. APC 3893]MDN3387641.1 ACP S-malonyltransferase [Pseudoalteromonas sp. APC 4017]
MKAYIFPGQGSQHKGMGEELFDLFQEYVQRADDVLGYSVVDLCLNDDKEVLGQTQFTQPALYIVNSLSFLAKVRRYEVSADFMVGHSLGEYSALFAAGVFDFEAGLEIVKKRGELMSQAHNGGMAAVVSCTAEKIKQILSQNSISSIDIANFNSPNQTVVAGPVNDLDTFRKIMEEAGEIVIPLNVSAPFHSRYMKEFGEEFGEFLTQYRFGAPRIPVISNVSAQPYKKETVTRLLTEQLSSSVRWTDSINYLLSIGVNDFEELGPGTVLSGLVRQIKSNYQEVESVS